MAFAPSKPRQPDPFSFRSKSQNPKSRKIILNDALSRKHHVIPPAFRGIAERHKAHSPENVQLPPLNPNNSGLHPTHNKLVYNKYHGIKH
mmetsp:Transcript_38322/g.34166  ORF Transcript_38322/g.34166 Transcript_38322/m.34166 type:complete len:90 (+) Transcript_38322:28-297(+)